LFPTRRFENIATSVNPRNMASRIDEVAIQSVSLRPLRPLVHRWFRESQGQDLIEYALLAAFISLFAYGAVGMLGESVNIWFNALGSFAEEKKSNCGPTGMGHSMGKCHGG
jgi:Flp pilus assembly pilin Flp